jgi:methionyl-tRNA formyltransferase
VPPLEEAAWNPGPNAPPIDYAPRLTKQDRYIDLSTCTLADILTVKRALGPPWIVLPNGKRLILLDLQSKFLVDAPEERSGIFFVPGMRYPVVKAKCGGTALVRASTYEGYPVGEGNAKAMPLLESLARGED